MKFENEFLKILIMKKQLLKFFTAILFMVATTSLNAQLSFTFDSGAEGFISATNGGVLTHNATDGTIELVPGAGGNEGFIVPGTIDANTYKFVTIVVKNETARPTLRARIGTSNTNIDANGAIATNSSTFETYELNLGNGSFGNSATDWVGNISELVIGFRGGGNADGGKITIDSITFTADSSLSVRNNTLEGVSIYNANKQLTINSPVAKTNVSLYNLLGSQVKSFSKSTKRSVVSVSDLATGLYIIKLESEGKIFTKKLLIH